MTTAIREKAEMMLDELNNSGQAKREGTALLFPPTLHY